MSYQRLGKIQSVGLIIAVLAVALLAWGGYVWRFTRSKNSTTPQIVQSAENLTNTTAPPVETPSQKTETVSPEPVAPPASQPAKTVTFAAGTWANRPVAVSDKATEIVPTPTPTPEPQSTSELTKDARDALQRGDIVVARTALTKAVEQGLAPQDADWARSELIRIADALIFSRATNVNDPLVARYSVQAGDNLHTIARKRQISESFLAKVNEMAKPDMLRAGERIKIINGPFWARVHKSDHRMDVYISDSIVRSFRVGLGSGGGTPTGTWLVRDKLKNPDWTDPITNRHYASDDPDNPIGERWIALQGIEGEALGKSGFGIHGTTDPASIGQDMSMGCIRLLAADVDLLFDLLVIKDSKVIVQP